VKSRRLDNALAATITGILDLRQTEATIDALPPDARFDGETVLITGANTGLGFGIAKDVARRGPSRLILACRSGIPEAGEAIARETGHPRVEMRKVDLSDLASVDALADALRDEGVRLDRVILNAGVMPAHDSATKQGFEIMFGVNFLANARLSLRLLEDGVIANRSLARDPSPAARPPRLVFVASDAHRGGHPLDFETFGEYRSYGITDGMKQYGHSKLALITFANALAKRLAPGGEPEVEVFAICPGAVNSNISRDAPAWLKPVLSWVMGRFFASPEKAAEPVVYLARADAMNGRTGVYVHMRAEKAPAEQALDPECQEKVWAATRDLLSRARSTER
jgi:NAD(P)-dependent dehydrogenase (short-subunit alcohol dehydrogenase family)